MATQSNLWRYEGTEQLSSHKPTQCAHPWISSPKESCTSIYLAGGIYHSFSLVTPTVWLYHGRGQQDDFCTDWLRGLRAWPCERNSICGTRLDAWHQDDEPTELKIRHIPKCRWHDGTETNDGGDGESLQPTGVGELHNCNGYIDGKGGHGGKES